MCLRESPTRSNSNWPAQPQKLARFLKFRLSKDIILSKQRTTKALIRLRGCAGWSAPLLFAYDIRHVFSAWPGSYVCQELSPSRRFDNLDTSYWELIECVYHPVLLVSQLSMFFFFVFFFNHLLISINTSKDTCMVHFQLSNFKSVWTGRKKNYFNSSLTTAHYNNSKKLYLPSLLFNECCFVLAKSNQENWKEETQPSWLSSFDPGADA